MEGSLSGIAAWRTWNRVPLQITIAGNMLCSLFEVDQYSVVRRNLRIKAQHKIFEVRM